MGNEYLALGMTLDEIQDELESIKQDVFWIGLELEFVLDKLEQKNDSDDE